MSETGGGKTLAYLLPIIETCLRMKTILSAANLNRTVNQPLAIIVVPTRELVFQVYNTLHQLLKSTQGSSDYETKLANINFVCDAHPDVIKVHRQLVNYPINCFGDEQSSPIDVLVTLPNRFKMRVEDEARPINSVYLKNIVMDEADTLMDDSYSETILECLGGLQLNLNLPKTNHSE